MPPSLILRGGFSLLVAEIFAPIFCKGSIILIIGRFERESSPVNVDEKLNKEQKVTIGHKTDFGWEVYPRGIYDLLKKLQDEYGVNEIIITENGCSYGDSPDENKKVNDIKRIEYHQSHIEQILIAIEEGIPCTGYFAWSLMDNFEWAAGYSQRFGMVWVDFDTLERIPKESYYWYQKFLKTQK